ncbi:hypothetical protein SI65_08465 [Aspergillus cristatus]|uniref:Uncharacterized protein n=1 Tax=Aspergillus cristatus TaxID=573508 RepID=A0A1E3B5F3_ASPCR|nr:hypothetical protein SI65_08465 [Aspergillus cristatus]
MEDTNNSPHLNPFLEVDGAFNLREFGGYPSTLFPGATTRKGFIYRIATVIDLTSAGEAEALCAGRTADTTEMQGGEDIKIIKLPLKQNAFSMDELEKKYRTYRSKAIAQDYLNLLHSATTPIRTILAHLLSHPTQPNPSSSTALSAKTAQA